MSSEKPPGKKTGQQITASQVAGVWRLRSAGRTAYGSTSDWFGAHSDGLLIFTDDLHFTEAVTRTDLPPVVSGDRLSATPQENRALAQGTLGCYGTYTTGQDGSLASQHVLGSTFPDWNNTERGADDVHVTVSDGRLSQVLRLGDDDTVELTWEYAGTAGAPTTANQVAAAWRLDSARVDTPGGTVQPFGHEPGGYLIFADSGYFTDVLHRPGLPALASGDRLEGTDEENERTVRDTLVVFGTYTVDDAGAFKDEQVLRSSFPNWNGMRRDTSSLTETVHGDTMTEHLDDGNGVVISLTFSRQK
ncbi:MAG: lipocalin-like domain-containing protein [Trebonia sp.]|uniref:lipocalin-like domain-containing protein n=1 Tax=Trebonia sp. TaxID=2767075 RepID=UPI003BB0A9E2